MTKPFLTASPAPDLRWVRTFLMVVSLSAVVSPAVAMTRDLMTRSQRVIANLLLAHVWPEGSREACIVAHLQQGLSLLQALDACKIDLTGKTVGATLPAAGVGASLVVVPHGSPTPQTAACVSAPGSGGFGAPSEDAGTEDDDLPPLPQPQPTQADLEKEREEALEAAEGFLKEVEKTGSELAAVAYQAAMSEVFHLDSLLNKNYGVPKPSYWPNRTVEGAESTCQQVNAFLAQCDASNWKSSECRAILDWINGCANSELSLVDGEQSCRLVAPGSAEAAVLLEMECSKLARGADGQNPCSRQPPQGANPRQVVIERCKAPDALYTPDDGGMSNPECPAADLEAFLQMALPARDFSFITSKIGGPKPPTGSDGGGSNPRGTPTPGGLTSGEGTPYPGVVRP